MSWRVGIDTGGTFTDLVAVNSETGELALHKVHSTPENPADAVVNGVLEVARRTGFSAGDIKLFIHGSTVATNAVLTRSGARLAMVTTKGFRDILQIRRQGRPELYDLRSRRPPSLIQRSHILEAEERIGSDGKILTPLSSKTMNEIISRLKTMEVDTIVVGFLNAYVNPDHEQLLGKQLREALPNMSICLTHEISPSQGEFERFSTTVLNGYVQPIVTRYLGCLKETLRDKGITSPLFVMKSNGGVAAANIVSRRSVEMLLSGPAGGVVAGITLARRHTNRNIITADMGGTSFDVSMVTDGEGVFTQERMFANQVIRLPMMDIETIGAGGGSIGWVDAGGALRVGPKSAGALPGPACYGRGGSQPTVTDANLILGRLTAHSSMAGGFQLDVEAAHAAMKRLADSLDLAVEETAEGVVQVVNANMMGVIRRLTVERGHNPEDFSLCPFGGAGPLHGAELAREIGMRNVVVPTMPGVFSALGLLFSELREEQIHSRVGLLTDLIEELPASFDRLLVEPKGRIGIVEMDEKIERVSRRLRLRYLGQGHDLALSLPDGPLNLSAIETDFHHAHHRAYGYNFVDEPIEVVAAWVSVSVDLQDTSLPPWPAHRSTNPHTHRTVIFSGRTHETPVYRREHLGAGFADHGPTIIEQADTTITVPPGMKYSVDRIGQLIMETE